MDVADSFLDDYIVHYTLARILSKFSARTRALHILHTKSCDDAPLLFVLL
jgi:hypothetical protein